MSKTLVACGLTLDLAGDENMGDPDLYLVDVESGAVNYLPSGHGARFANQGVTSDGGSGSFELFAFSPVGNERNTDDIMPSWYSANCFENLQSITEASARLIHPALFTYIYEYNAGLV